jgi:hypothetical protein
VSGDLKADLTLTVFLYHFRRQLIDYRVSAAIDMATPGEVIDVVVRSLDQALTLTKGAQKEQRTF